MTGPGHDRTITATAPLPEERTMKKTIARLAAVAAVSTLALAGCGGLVEDEEPVAAPTIEEAEEEDAAAVDAPAIEEEDTEKAEPAAEQGGPGVYQAELMGGGIATVAVPGEGPEDIEQFR